MAADDSIFTKNPLNKKFVSPTPGEITFVAGENKDYYVVVSKDPLYFQTVNFSFNLKGKLKEITPLNSYTEGGSFIQLLEFQRTFIPGGYRIFEHTY